MIGWLHRAATATAGLLLLMFACVLSQLEDDRRWMEDDDGQY